MGAGLRSAWAGPANIITTQLAPDSATLSERETFFVISYLFLRSLPFLGSQSIRLFLDEDTFTIASCMYGEWKQKLAPSVGKV